MIEIRGACNSALVCCDELDEIAAAQIQAMCDQAEFAGSKIRIMPDVHAGKGCTIGTTMTISDKVVPAMVGVDIGCGMETTRLAEREIDFARLDELIRAHIPAGREVRTDDHPLNAEINLTELRCAEKLHLQRARRSIGTLGGGNHFIEVDRDDEGALYLVIHSGSRYLGKEAAEYYQQLAVQQLSGNAPAQLAEIMARLKAEGRAREIETTIKRLKKEGAQALSLPQDLAYLTGELFNDYLHDMKMIQRFAVLNRQAMLEEILRGLGLTKVAGFTTIHNYIDTEAMILRKGAVSARQGEKLLIPINMRDGSLVCQGLGNAEWNFSAPHGAGRLISRGAAFATLSLEQYHEQMQGVFTTCICRDTLDEAPMAYKSLDFILSHIAPTARIIKRIKPVYNFKAGK